MKGYVGTLTLLKESIEVANRCVISGKQYGVDVDIVPSTHKDNYLEVLEEEGLFIASEETERKLLPKYHRTESNRGAVLGNFLTQYRIWKLIQESNEPGIVLEHDAVFVSEVPDLNNKGDIINLGKPSYGYFTTKDTPGVYQMFSKPGGYIPGAHGYYVTPKGAYDLIHKAKEIGACPCDLFLNHKIFPNIKEIWPHPIEAHDTFTTIQNEQGCQAKHNYKKDRRKYRILNFGTKN